MALQPYQVDNLLAVLRAGIQTGASYKGLVVGMEIGFGENGWASDTCNSGGYCGVFQIGQGFQHLHTFTDTAFWAVYAYERGFYGQGGINQIVAAHPDESAGWCANACQGAYLIADYYSDPYYDRFQAQAEQAIQTYYREAAGGPAPAAQQLPSPRQGQAGSPGGGVAQGLGGGGGAGAGQGGQGSAAELAMHDAHIAQLEADMYARLAIHATQAEDWSLGFYNTVTAITYCDLSGGH